MKNTSPANNGIVVVGQHVSTNLFGFQSGVITGIYGEQSPSTVERMAGGMMATGGNAAFDVVLGNGQIIKRIPEAILRGPQWKIIDEISTPEKVSALLSNAFLKKVQEEEKEQNAEARFKNAVEAMKINPEYAALNQDGYGAAHVGKNIRIELKKAFPGIKFSVTKSSYDAVRIVWTDGPTKERVENITGKYQEKSYNGMEDLSEYIKSPFLSVFGGVGYVFPERKRSDALIAKAIELAREKNGEENVPADITVEDFKTGRLLNVGRERFWHGLGHEIATIAGETDMSQPNTKKKLVL